MNEQEALACLEAGQVVLRDRQLFRAREDVILVSSAAFTARLDRDGFLALYGGQGFSLYKPGAAIDPEKDEAYYQWRREKQ